MSKDGFELSLPQAHELGLALRRPENITWTAQLVHKLGQGNFLQLMRQVLLGTAVIAESGRLAYNGKLVLSARQQMVLMKMLFRVETDSAKRTVISKIDPRFTGLFLQTNKRVHVQRPEQEVHCFQVGDNETRALMEWELVDIFGHTSHLAFTLDEVRAILGKQELGQAGLLDTEGNPNFFLVLSPTSGHQWVYLSFERSGWKIAAADAFIISDEPVFFVLKERIFTKKHYLK